MGCVCGKASSAVEDDESQKLSELSRKASELHLARDVSSKKGIPFQNGKLEKESGLMDSRGNGECAKKLDQVVVSNFPVIRNIPGAVEGESVAAGWPSWLVQVAGEAVRGWIPRKAETFEKLDKIGEGTYSNVYKGRDLINKKAVALKKVRFDNMDPESVNFMAREIVILRRLNHPNIINLEGVIVSKTCSTLYLVFEYMEHDLTGISSLPGIKFTEPQIKCYMRQLFSGLDYCHSNGVLHRDIKGSNLLIDNRGILKIADFGLATCFDNQLKNRLTSRVVTLWYRPPELLLGSVHYGPAIDLWSAGCVLGELYTGKAILTGRNEVEQLHNIFKLCGSPSEDYWMKFKISYFPGFIPYRRRVAEAFRDLPDVAVALMETLLSIDPSDRGTASSARNSEYFKTEPLACDPSSLPKFAPSKEMDVKLREEGARRCSDNKQGVKGIKSGTRAARPPLPNSDFVESKKKTHPNDVRDDKGVKRVGTSSDSEARIFPRSYQSESVRISRADDDSGPHALGAKDYHFSGPLVSSSNKIDQVLRNHDRLIQEASRRMRAGQNAHHDAFVRNGVR